MGAKFSERVSQHVDPGFVAGMIAGTEIVHGCGEVLASMQLR
jgi:hypothetical protein